MVKIKKTKRKVRMDRYKNLMDLCNSIEKIEDNYWIYTNIDKWESTPELAVFYTIDEDELMDLEDEDETIENLDGEQIPEKWGDNNVSTWLELQTLQAIIFIVKKKVLIPDINILIKAIDYYREYDDFMEVED
jgi:hypothetical protein